MRHKGFIRIVTSVKDRQTDSNVVGTLRRVQPLAAEADSMAGSLEIRISGRSWIS